MPNFCGHRTFLCSLEYCIVSLATRLTNKLSIKCLIKLWQNYHLQGVLLLLKEADGKISVCFGLQFAFTCRQSALALIQTFSTLLSEAIKHHKWFCLRKSTPERWDTLMNRSFPCFNWQTTKGLFTQDLSLVLKTAEHNRRSIYMHIKSQTLANVHLKMFILPPRYIWWPCFKTVSDLICN